MEQIYIIILFENPIPPIIWEICFRKKTEKQRFSSLLFNLPVYDFEHRLNVYD